MPVPSVFPGRIIFDHLPKTAGQAVNHWLRTTLGTACVTPNMIGRHRELIHQYGGEYSVISAHIKFSGEGLDPRYHYVSCVREPVDRAISWLYFVINNHSAAQLPHSWEVASKFIKTECVWQAADNFIASNGEQVTDAIRFNQIGHHICNPYVEHFSSILPGHAHNDEDKIRRALAAIGQYSCWGLYEQMPEFIREFADLISPGLSPNLELVNSTRDRPKVSEIPDRLRKSIESLNALDIEFYQRLKALYLHRDQNQLPSPEHSHAPIPLNLVAKISHITPGLEIETLAAHCENIANSRNMFAFTLALACSRNIQDPHAEIAILDKHKNQIFSTRLALAPAAQADLGAGYYHVRYFTLSNLKPGDYSINYILTEYAELTKTELVHQENIASFAIASSDYTDQVHQQISISSDIQKISHHTHNVINDARGNLSCVQDSLFGQAGTGIKLMLGVHNQSDTDWIASGRRPINISYRILDEHGTIIISEGLRTPLPLNILPAKQSLLAGVDILLPDNPGQYTLRIIPVQESVCWFDERGFTPLNIPLIVSCGN